MKKIIVVLMCLLVLSVFLISCAPKISGAASYNPQIGYAQGGNPNNIQQKAMPGTGHETVCY